MSAKHDYAALGWLKSLVDTKRSRIAALLRRLTGLEAHGANPSMFGKFLDLLEQVSKEQREEEEIISRIEGVEERHRMRRMRRQLEKANPYYEPEDESEDERPTHGLWRRLAFWHDKQDSPAPHDKQNLAND